MFGGITFGDGRTALRSGRAVDRSPIGLAFSGFVLSAIVILAIGVAERRAALGPFEPKAVAQLGVVGATLFTFTGLFGGYRAIIQGERTQALVAFGPTLSAALWMWAVFVRGSTNDTLALITVILGSVSAILLFSRGLRVARWFDVFVALGLLDATLAAATARSDLTAAPAVLSLALLGSLGGMTALFGLLVEIEQEESVRTEELHDARSRLHRDIDRTEELLHDLRSGLLAIELAIAGSGDASMTEIRREATRLRQLAAHDSRSSTQFDLVEPVRALVETRRSTGIEIDLRSPESATVEGDVGEVLSVVENLLANAIRHGESPISVEILPTDDSRLELAVSDAGSGIESADSEWVFERGASTDPFGSGIGLHRAARLAAANNGSLHLSDNDGQQSARFVLDLMTSPEVVADEELA